jgi:hypothetical protein
MTKLYRLRNVDRRPPTHKQMAKYVPYSDDEGVVISEADLAATIIDFLNIKPDGYLLVQTAEEGENNGS